MNPSPFQYLFMYVGSFSHVCWEILPLGAAGASYGWAPGWPGSEGTGQETRTRAKEPELSGGVQKAVVPSAVCVRRQPGHARSSLC